MFGIYSTSRREHKDEDKGIMVVQLLGQVEKKGSGQVTSLFIKPSPNCPFRYLRKPNSKEVANCKVVENACDWFWPNKVCLEITKSIEATTENPVELLCDYAYPPSTYTRQVRKRKRRPIADAEDEDLEDDDADVQESNDKQADEGHEEEADEGGADDDEQSEPAPAKKGSQIDPCRACGTSRG